jgi:hypothetical protein
MPVRDREFVELPAYHIRVQTAAPAYLLLSLDAQNQQSRTIVRL